MRIVQLSLVLLVSATLLQACGGGGGGGGSQTPPTPLTPLGTSYENFKSIGLTPQLLPVDASPISVRAYGDFTGNGRLDMFIATMTYLMPRDTPENAPPAKFEIWARRSDGGFTRSDNLPAGDFGCIHPRKPIVADFNNDGRADIFVACHGYDAAPFPGETNKILLSQPNGSYTIQDASPDVGFFHAATAADINGDGWIDVMATDNFDPERVIVLINQQNGLFQREPTGRLPQSIRSGNYFTIELVDVDQDGKLDLLLGGHEWEGAPTGVFINNSDDHDFSAVAPVELPAVANEGVVLDFVLTGSGDSRTIWINRTSGGDGTFYTSRVLQRVSWPGLQSTVVLNERPATWVLNIIPTVVGGNPVIAGELVGDQMSVRY